MIFNVLEEIIGKIIESRYIAICPIIDKLSISVIEFHNLSAILGNYRQSYRYRKWQENYWKFIVIEKNDLSPTPNHGRPSRGLAAGANLIRLIKRSNEDEKPEEYRLNEEPDQESEEYKEEREEYTNKADEQEEEFADRSAEDLIF